MSVPITLQRFLTEDFFSLLGLQELSDTQKAELIEKMNQTVLARAYARVYDQLEPAEREELDNISVDNMVPFLEERDFNIHQLIIDEALLYRMELAKMFEMVTESVEPGSEAPVAAAPVAQ